MELPATYVAGWVLRVYEGKGVIETKFVNIEQHQANVACFQTLAHYKFDNFGFLKHFLNFSFTHSSISTLLEISKVYKYPWMKLHLIENKKILSEFTF